MHQELPLRTARRVNRRLIGGFVAMLLLLSACGGDGDPPSAGGGDLPSTYKGEFLQVLEGQPGEGGEVVFGAKLTAEDGTTADLELTFTDAPPGEGGSVECGGRTYEAEAILDQSATAAGTLEIAGHGTAVLDVERNVGVITAEGPPVCDEWSGTWTGSGNLGGESGTFTYVGFHGEEEDEIEGTLTLEQD